MSQSLRLSNDKVKSIYSMMHWIYDTSYMRICDELHKRVNINLYSIKFNVKDGTQ